jgi:hypothetical protein
MRKSGNGHTHILLMSSFLWPPLWSSGYGSWLQIQRSGFDSRRYQIFWEVVGLERGPLSLMRIIEELFQGNSGSGLENRCLRDTLYPLKWALTSPTSGGRSIGIVRFADWNHEVCLFVCFVVFSLLPLVRYCSLLRFTIKCPVWRYGRVCFSPMRMFCG